MIRVFLSLLAVFSTLAPVVAQTPDFRTSSGELFRLEGSEIRIPVRAGGLELRPVIVLIGASMEHSASAGTWRVKKDEIAVDLSPGSQFANVAGNLVELAVPVTGSADGLNLRLDVLDKTVLEPFGFHRIRHEWGHEIIRGPRPIELLRVRATALDQGPSTTLVLSLERHADAEIVVGEEGEIRIGFIGSKVIFEGAPPRSRRVRSLRPEEGGLLLLPGAATSVLNHYPLDGPPRLVLQLGQPQPTPMPSDVQIPDVVAGRQIIVIDPGHGGEDTGAAASDGSLEKEITLGLALELASELRQRGYSVRLTRDDDTKPSLIERTSMANRLEAAAFISLHANASSYRSVHGAETYYVSLDSHTDEGEAIAAIENAGELSRPDDPLELILWDMAQADVLNESARLAELVQIRLNALLGLKDRGVKQAPFVVLTGATMPAILLEVGFLSNLDEAQRLATQEHRQALARTIAEGLELFLGGGA